jgi:hypothetical protein
MGSALTFRKYEQLSAYLPVLASRGKAIEAMVSSRKRPVDCPADCVCMGQGSYCEYDLFKGEWVSECPNRRNKVECQH